MVMCLGLVVFMQITVLHQQALNALHEENTWCRVRPTFTVDLWCSATQRKYLTISVHWIEENWHTIPPQRQCQWPQHRRVVATVQIEGDDKDKVTAPGEIGVCNGCLATVFAIMFVVMNGGVHCIVVLCVVLL